MKPKSAAKFFIAFGVLLAVFSFWHFALADAESINNFSARMAVQSDGSVLVSEAITYDFGSNERHGIYRDIPLTSQNGPDLSIAVDGVSDESGRPYQYAVSRTGNILEIKIGDSNTLVSGVKTYIINYKVYNAIRTFSDHQELYWNVTGNGWQVGIQSAAAAIALPYSPATSAQMACFTGLAGSTEKACSFSQIGKTIDYSASRPLSAGEGLTIVIGLPSNYITSFAAAPAQSYSINTPPINSQSFVILMISFSAIAILMIIFSIFMRRIGSKNIKTNPLIPKELKHQPVVVAYNPPDDLKPIEVQCLLDREVEATGVSATIIDLAVRGYIKIRYISETVAFILKEKSFELVKTKEGSDLVLPADKIVFNLLFSGRDSVKLGDLGKYKIIFMDTFKEIQSDTEQLMTDKGYFDPGREKYSNFLKYLISQPILALFKKLTPTGISAVAKILGFKEFLQLTEKDRLALLDAPNLEPQMFEKFLPYAMVLGVEGKWAAKFENIYNIAPVWYEGQTGVGFNSIALAQNLALFNGSFSNVLGAATSSGFAGGGSGGGSGGGGGGSW